MRFYEAGIGALTVGRSPGEIVVIEEAGIEVAATGGAIRIGKLRLEKGEKVGPTEFARSVGLKAGDRLGN